MYIFIYTFYIFCFKGFKNTTIFGLSSKHEYLWKFTLWYYYIVFDNIYMDGFLNLLLGNMCINTYKL